MKAIIATKNKNKLIEMKRILIPMGIELISENDLTEPLPEVVEDGATFKENAFLKARSACRKTGLAAIADDSGLCVDALNGAPGIYSARYAGEPSDSDKNNKKLLMALKNVSEEKRTARFISAVACVFPDGREFCVEGKCEGKIAFSERGSRGFGYDPLFISEIGCFAELSPMEKDSISHRADAMRKFETEIKKYI